MLQLQPTTTQHPHKKTTHLAKAIIKKQKTTLKKLKNKNKNTKTNKNKNKKSNTNKTKNQKTKKIEILLNIYCFTWRAKNQYNHLMINC